MVVGELLFSVAEISDRSGSLFGLVELTARLIELCLVGLSLAQQPLVLGAQSGELVSLDPSSVGLGAGQTSLIAGLGVVGAGLGQLGAGLSQICPELIQFGVQLGEGLA